MPNPSIPELVRAAGLDTRNSDLTEADLKAFLRYMETAEHAPLDLVVELVRQHARVRETQSACEKATGAADKLEKMIQDLLEGQATFYHPERLRKTPQGLELICNCNGTMRGFPIHPNVEPEKLDVLKSWEFVTVSNQGIITGYWSDDPLLFHYALGHVVEFKGYQDPESHTVRIMDGHQERVATLDQCLWDVALTPRQKLILHRDNNAKVIDTVPLENAQSRFEQPIEGLQTRLEDLAGVEQLTESLLEDILLRVCCPDIRDSYRLEPLKGILLYSYKPGMGKTALVRAVALWLHEHRDDFGFDVVLYVVKPNETKSMWHGEDARIIREDLWGAIRARQALPRSRPLVILVALDEIDSLGKRAGRGEATYSSAQSEGLEAMLVEMDGLIQNQSVDGPASYVLCWGLTNRPDRVDEAAKRPGRLSLVLPMPDVTEQSAAEIMAIYARGQALPWYIGGEVCCDVSPEVIRSQFLRPTLASLFHEVIVRYATDTQKVHEVTVGQLLANVHYMDAMNRAKKRAACRQLRHAGIPAVTRDDIIDCLLDVSCEFARQTEADPQMLIRQLDIKIPVVRVDAVPRRELDGHRYLRLHAS